MAPTTADSPRVTPPWPRSPSCRTRNPHNVVGDVGILSSLGLPGRRVPMLVRAPGGRQRRRRALKWHPTCCGVLGRSTWKEGQASSCW